MRTRTDQLIEQIAGIIHERLDWGYATLDEMAAINAGDGWTIDVRYDDGDYTDDNGYTREEGVRLSPADWRRAVALATTPAADLLTYAAAAEMLGVTSSRAYQLATRGALVRVDLGTTGGFVTRASVEHRRDNPPGPGKPKRP
jgi:hypothetical protein